ncbi:MAG: hypothetical protein U0270_39040 [Labilithrix sp.]
MKRSSRSPRAAWLFGLVALLSTRSALADDETPPPLPPTDPVTIQVPQPAAAAPPPAVESTPAPATTLRTDLWKISTGARISYIPSAGFDTFSTNDVLAQWSLEGQYPVLSRGRFALGVGLGYAGGARTATTRGDKTALGVHTLQVPIEGRYHVGRWGYAFARVAPGTTAVVASVEEGSSPNRIEDTQWVFASDLSAGAAILMGPRGHDQADKRSVRFWAVPEIGYTLATTARLDARPDRDAKDALGTDERTALPGLNLSSFYWRLSLATTF